MHNSYVFLNALTSSDILLITDGLSSRQISIKALGIKKKVKIITKPPNKQREKKTKKHPTWKVHCSYTLQNVDSKTGIFHSCFFKCKQVFLIKMAPILTN